MDTYTKLELTVKIGPSEAEARQYSFTSVIQGPAQDRFDSKVIETLRNIFTMGFSYPLEYFIAQHQSVGTLITLVYDSGNTSFVLRDGDLAVIPRANPDSGGDYISVTAAEREDLGVVLVGRSG